MLFMYNSYHEFEIIVKGCFLCNYCATIFFLCSKFQLCNIYSDVVFNTCPINEYSMLDLAELTCTNTNT